ncbi:hypothetical protein [uncultured Limnobacter sp.]|uniref:hypothetical protein n=1 Tax=uncultured Limnobacter sp. TaxID=199681 RepID=UPI0030F6F432
MNSLNPLIKSGLMANGALGSQTLEESVSAGYTEVTMYKCNECGDLHDWSDDAEDCCAEIEKITKVFCPVCASNEHGSYSQAVDCCLWKDLPINKRLSIVDEMEGGSTWIQAILKATGGA